MVENSVGNSGGTNPPQEDKTDFMKRGMEILRRVRELHPFSPEERISVDIDRRAFLQEEWNERTWPMTAGELRELLLSREFGQKVVEAILGTDDWGVVPKFGKEFGFVVFHHPGDMRSLHISPLFQGDERSINLFVQSEEYRKQRDLFGSQGLVFHTHPNIIRAYLWNEVLMRPSVPENDFFSGVDLKSFRKIAEDEDMALIYALGIKNRDERGGRLLLVSFNNFAQFIDFDPEGVIQKSLKYRSTQAGAPIDVYRDSGLNVAVLSVNLNAGSVFRVREVEQASRILTSRVV